LDRASLKIVSGKAEEAVVLLESLNREFPENTEALELLGLARSEIGDYLEAAFWYEQVAGLHPNGTPFLKLAGECYELAGEDASANLAYSAYVSRETNDGHVWHKLYQLRSRAARKPGLPEPDRKQLETEALNAILKAKGAATAEEALEIARLFRKKNILPEAEFWFEAVSTNPQGDQRGALLGLLEVYLARKDDDKAETTAQLLNKRFPEAIDEDAPLATKVTQLLAKRHAATFFVLKHDPEGRPTSELFAALEQGVEPTVVPSGKLSLENTNHGATDPKPPDSNDSVPLAALFGFKPSPASSSPPEQNATQPDKATDFLERAELALLAKNYRGAERFLKEVIKETPANATAWFLRSRTHLLDGENEKAEMYATEAVRLAPDDLEIRLHYIESARSVLSARHFLRELNEAHEQFPQSLDFLWQLAQQFHVVEGKTAVAAILYRRFLNTAPPNHPMRERVQLELAAAGNP
tara:strand:- start:180 stop:1589 length:1410 start_codon:yes stop_codon:yes gene_type:complete